jgi:hypothetical protein
MRIVLSVLLLSIPLVQGSTPRELTDPEAYRVYAALLPDEWTVQSAHAETLVFEEETSMSGPCSLPSGGALETEWRDVLDDFRQRNATPMRLRPGMALGIPYLVVSRASLQALFATVGEERAGGWTTFYDMYPRSGGYMTISAVGFNVQKTRAMVYIGHSCGNLCGGGTYHFLEKSSRGWREVKLRDVTSCAWAS